MTQNKYVCGFDFGTLSCRLIVCDLSDGKAVFENSVEYSDGVITEKLPDSDVRLGSNWALQNPDDYINAMTELMRQASEKIDLKNITAIGTDFTNCSVVAIDNNGNPLCSNKKYRNNPHSWVKLWKHHAAQVYAERIEKQLRDSHTEWFDEYGDNVSSEWFFPKVLQVYEEARDIFDAAYAFIECADYITLFLTGKIVRNSATLGVNSFYDRGRGFPSKEFLNSLSEGFADGIYPKLCGDIKPVGSRAGTLCDAAAKRLGLNSDVAVAVGHGDSEVAAAGLGITEPGSMLMVMGTSSCYQMIHTEKVPCRGVCAIVQDGMIPGLVAYESGQPAVGDAFAWYANNAMPASYVDAADKCGLSRLAYMDKKAAELNAGESGLVSLDWFNGNRSVLMDYNLTACFAGLTLASKPEGIYRSMIEATAFGARRIFESYAEAKVAIKRVYALGGLSHKSPLTMQIYADILGMPIEVTSIPNACSFGACICGAVARENEIGTREAFAEVCGRMVHFDTEIYYPDSGAVRIYNKLYSVFCELHDFAGRHSNICTDLTRIQQASKTAFEQ
ncbi:MAG: ribulokinase [Oscillospiraceae bacterium]